MRGAGLKAGEAEGIAVREGGGGGPAPVAFLVAKDRWQGEQIFWAKMSIPNYEAESGS